MSKLDGYTPHLLEIIRAKGAKSCLCNLTFHSPCWNSNRISAIYEGYTSMFCMTKVISLRLLFTSSHLLRDMPEVYLWEMNTKYV